MDYGVSDSSGTDDDLPPSHQNKFRSVGSGTGNGRSMAVGNGPLPRVQNDMETQIHLIDQETYSSVLRAFKAQSDAITWYGSASFNGRDQVSKQQGFGEDNSSDPLIGRKVWTRWSEDNNFYEAVIKDFNPVDRNGVVGWLKVRVRVNVIFIFVMIYLNPLVWLVIVNFSCLVAY